MNLPRLFASFLLFTMLATAASASTTPLSTISPNDVVLKPCEQNTFLVSVSGLEDVERNLEVNVNGLPGFVEFFAPSQVLTNGGKAELQVLVSHPCSADTAAGVYPFSVTFNHNGEQIAAASAVLSTSSRTGLSVELEQTDLSPQGGSYACACDSGHFSLRLRNAGSQEESGNIILSSPFASSISGSAYNLHPGETEEKQIIIDIPCNATNGVYPFSVALLRPGVSGGDGSGFSSPVISKPSQLSVGRCYAAHVEGPTYISQCLGESLRARYAVYNDGEVTRTYSLETNLGRTIPLEASVEPHSSQQFEVVIPARQLNVTGRYGFTLMAQWNEDFYTLPVEMDVAFCQGVTQETMLGDFSDVLGGFDLPRGTARKFLVNIVNDNSYPWHNAVIEVSGFGAVSQPFDINAGENKSIEIMLNAPVNFTTHSANFYVVSDEGSDGVIVELRAGPTPLSAFFTAFTGGKVTDIEIALIAVALLIALGIIYHVKITNEKRAAQDEEIADSLESILTKRGV